jgi:hypothetical protein
MHANKENICCILNVSANNSAKFLGSPGTTDEKKHKFKLQQFIGNITKIKQCNLHINSKMCFRRSVFRIQN